MFYNNSFVPPFVNFVSLYKLYEEKNEKGSSKKVLLNLKSEITLDNEYMYFPELLKKILSY